MRSTNRGRGTGPAPWHLPGLPENRDRAGVEGTAASGRSYRVPRLDGTDAEAVAREVRRAALETRRELPTSRVVAAASRAALRLADPSDPAGAEALDVLSDELDWPESLSRETLAGMARGWTREALSSVLERELGGTAVLDGWADADSGALPGRRRRAAGPPLLLVVHAGNVPGVAVTAALRGLLVRSGVLCRAPGSEPGLLACFARALAAEDPLLGRCLATAWWPSGEEAPWSEWVKRSGKVVVYGGDAAIDGVRDRVPAHVDIVAYGPRLGIAVLLPDAELDGAAAALARDVCAYEQQGCVSPRLVYAVGRDPAAVGQALGSALDSEVARLPRPAPDAATAVAVRSARAEAEFAGLAGRPVGLETSGEGPTWTVVVGGDPCRSDSLPRFVRVHGVADVDELERLLEPLEGRLQSVGYAGAAGAEALAEAAARLGACRVAPVGTLAWPPSDWLHDGRPQLLPLLDWTEWE
jgi:hypothetical protein